MIRIERSDGLGRATCRACGARIVWALTDRGKRAPINWDPSDNGNMVLVYDDSGEEAGKPRVTAVAYFEQSTGTTVPPQERRLNHFATCPEAERFSAADKPAANNTQLGLFTGGKN